MALENLTDNNIRELANTELAVIVETCRLLLDEEQTVKYLDYLISGTTAIREGFVGEMTTREDD